VNFKTPTILEYRLWCCGSCIHRLVVLC